MDKPTQAPLIEAEYLRQRLSPEPGDQLYLHLSDLKMALELLKSTEARKILDYGCGGSPYRSLFSQGTYHRADLRGGASLDFEYGPDSRLPLGLSNYDCVLSTQVLEHVEEPQVYLGECYRVLRPGGRLILTTHGLFEDHACPNDYWRWTVYGLKRLIQHAGMKVEAAKKVTTGPRCALFLAERELSRMQFGAAGAYGKLLSLGVRAVRRLGAQRRHRASDISLSRFRVVDIEEPGHGMYVAVAFLASRPT
jgi:SAM-dependent methyltransferase